MSAEIESLPTPYREVRYEATGNCQIEARGSHDACWAMRTSIYSRNVHGHDLAWGNEGLWMASTLFSCLCTLEDGYNFAPRWRPKFITQLIDQDRCHLNGLAMDSGQPKYVTVLAESDSPAGWRVSKATTGAVIDVDSGEVVTRGLGMPHSPRIHAGKLWVLDSGTGALVTVDRVSGERQGEDESCVAKILGNASNPAIFGLAEDSADEPEAWDVQSPSR